MARSPVLFSCKVGHTRNTHMVYLNNSPNNRKSCDGAVVNYLSGQYTQPFGKCQQPLVGDLFPLMNQHHLHYP